MFNTPVSAAADPAVRTAAIQMTNVSHSFGSRKVLQGIELQVQPGESVAIMGRSGSGKTTLLSCLLGLVTPQSGEVTLAGVRLRTLSRKQRARLRAEHVGVVFQHGELVADLTAEENVALPTLMSGQREAAYVRARALLSEFEVDPRTSARDLSGGEVQRTALARALVNDPTIILADEPTGSLDTELRDRAANRLFRLPRERNCALVVVTHDPALASLADRTYELIDHALRPAVA